METIKFKATMDNIEKILNEMGIEQTSAWESYGDGIACNAKKEDKEELMTFEQALVKLKEGHFVARMYKDEDCELALLGVDAKLMVVYETEIIPCLLTSESLLANDWYVSR